MKYNITIFDNRMNTLYHAKRMRGFVKCIKNNTIKRSNRKFGNYSVEYDDIIVVNREYTATNKDGELFYIWLCLEKNKQVGGR